MPRLPLLATLVLCFASPALAAEPPKLDTRRGDAMLANYFRHETARLA